MAVLKALRQTSQALRRNPVLFVPMLAVMALQFPQMALRAVEPLLASVVSLGISLAFMVVMPFVQAGVVGMADEALDGRTSLGRFMEAGRSNYVSMLVAYLTLMAVNFVLGMVVFFVAVFVGVAFAFDSGPGVGIVVLAVVGVVAALVLLAYLLLVFFVQFYAQAIVIDDFGAIDGLKHSVSVVHANPVSTLGYTLLVGVLGGIVGAISGVASVLVSPRSAAVLPLPELSAAGVVGVAVALVVVGTLFGGFLGVYSVAFYRTVAP